MADILSTVETTIEGIAFGTGGTGALPQVAPQGTAARAGYDRVVDAANRLPRPIAALMALALFVDAAIEPAGFAQRMQALAAMPQPMWWLLGAILTFFFGARETHYMRHAADIAPPAKA